MNLSGLLVTVKQGKLEAVIKLLRAIPGVSIYQYEGQADRVVAVVEADSVSSEVDKFNEIKKVPDVIDVALINHFFEDETEVSPLNDLTKLNQI